MQHVVYLELADSDPDNDPDDTADVDFNSQINIGKTYYMILIKAFLYALDSFLYHPIIPKLK